MASGNAGKLREIVQILSTFDVHVVPQSEFGIGDAEETGKTFIENALIKARHAAAATGLPAIGDDSGLAVDALDGSPGVYTARYAGPCATDAQNIDKLLTELHDIPADRRGAAFRCAACFVMPDNGEPLIAEGEWRGTILTEPRGDAGFGYDPVFFDPELEQSAAELDAEVKNSRSHRGKAMRALAKKLAAAEWN